MLICNCFWIVIPEAILIGNPDSKGLKSGFPTDTGYDKLRGCQIGTIHFVSANHFPPHTIKLLLNPTPSCPNPASPSLVTHL
jgi:hypothetical protein